MMRIALYSVKVSREDERLKELINSLIAHKAEVFWIDKVEDLQGADLVLSIGGDGTFLRLITIMNGSQVPVAGINFGHLGFLTTASAKEREENWIADLVNGNYSIDKRILIKAESNIIPNEFYPIGLNEFAIHNTATSMLHISISINKLCLPSYWADGVIVSTPTGSTAYSLSVGGPIVTPDSDVLIISPVAPHNLNVRPIVAPANSVIEVKYSSKRGGALLTMDNRAFEAPHEGEIVITKAEYGANCVRLRNINFINALRDKLLWGEDRRN